ncbi:unnamed protein product, partial [marine sediment metagenome]
CSRGVNSSICGRSVLILPITYIEKISENITNIEVMNKKNPNIFTIFDLLSLIFLFLFLAIDK